MRIIAGKYKGRSLQGIKGVQTRPTTDRVKEAWCSTLSSLNVVSFNDMIVLDAFAGTGALGLEVMSRGATKICFCDNSIAAIRAIKNNINSLSIDQNYIEVIKCDALVPNFTAILDKQVNAPISYNTVFLDPPYNTSLAQVAKLIEKLITAQKLQRPSIISYEHESNKNLGLANMVLQSDTAKDELVLLSAKTYGTTMIEYFVYKTKDD